MLFFMPIESRMYTLGKHLAASKRKNAMTWTNITSFFFSHNEKARDGHFINIWAAPQKYKYQHNLPSWLHSRHHSSRQSICILSRRGRQQERKRLYTQIGSFLLGFHSKAFPEDPQYLSSSVTWLPVAAMVTGKKYLAFQPLKWEEQGGVNVTWNDWINKKKGALK